MFLFPFAGGLLLFRGPEIASPVSVVFALVGAALFRVHGLRFCRQLDPVTKSSAYSLVRPAISFAFDARSGGLFDARSKGARETLPDASKLRPSIRWDRLSRVIHC